jgi:hypothetical protein
MKLVFVYNAESGAINAVKDFFHKTFRPTTYPCRLCAVTYGSFTMKNEWRTFVSQLEIPVEFLHIDEFREKYSISNPEFPSAFVEQDGQLEYFITADEMNLLNSLDELKSLVDRKLQNQIKWNRES